MAKAVGCGSLRRSVLWAVALIRRISPERNHASTIAAQPWYLSRFSAAILRSDGTT
jgi:hypothetical protein